MWSPICFAGWASAPLAHNGASEVNMAKQIMRPPRGMPEVEGVKVGYTADEVIGCIDAMYESGDGIWSLKFFIASPKHLSDFIEKKERFDPDAVYSRRKRREEEVSVRIRRTEGF